MALGNTRLGIVGLDDGFQPLHNEMRTVWLSANGEIFNHVELRRHLAGKGHRFATGSDCEAIVHAYEEWGDAAFARLEGQFAFALWDARARRLVLVRDRLGILPLHYAVVGGAAVFASEAKALFAGGRIEPRIEPAALGQLFTTWSVVAPRLGLRRRPGRPARQRRLVRPRRVALGAPLVGADVRAGRRRRPAACARRRGRRARAPPPPRGRAPAPGRRAGRRVPERRARLVPSSAAFGVEATEGPLATFGVGFSDARYDETASRDVVARLLGTRHHDELFRARDLEAVLDEAVWSCETPLLRSGPLPFFLLARSVRGAGLKAVFSGEGADELLAGYSIFKEDRVRRFWAARSRVVAPARAPRPAPSVRRGARGPADGCVAARSSGAA